MPDIPHVHICATCEDEIECMEIDCEIKETDEVFCNDCDAAFEEDDDDLDDLYDDSID